MLLVHLCTFELMKEVTIFFERFGDLHGCKESCGAETVTINIIVIIISIVKYLQTIGHGEQITLHFVFIQVIVKVVIIKVKVVMVLDVVDFEAPIVMMGGGL